jgi:hypothetical protein
VGISRRTFLFSGMGLASAATFANQTSSTDLAAQSLPDLAGTTSRASPVATASGATLPFWDGPSGITWQYANMGYLLPWTNPGGDWLDANGVAQGQAHYATARVVDGSPVRIDITALARKWYASGNTGAMLVQAGRGEFEMYSRHRNDPSLWPSLSLSDGSQTLRAPCTCCGQTNKSTSQSVQDPALGLDWNTQRIIVQFSLPPIEKLVSATLVLQQLRNWGGFTIGVYEPLHPKVFSGGVPTQGLAASYTRDKGISVNPNVIYATDFSDKFRAFFNEGDIWERTTTYGPEPELGVNGINSRYAIGALTPMSLLHRFSTFGQAGPDELYFRYYLFLGRGYQCATEGKKLPGLAGRYGVLKNHRYDISLGGNGGDRVSGRSTSPAHPSQALSGFSLRHHAHAGPGDANPLTPQVPLNYYAYTAPMEGPWGDYWRWGNATLGWCNLYMDRWYCIEHRVKMNSLSGPADANGNRAANADGIVQGWVDGVLCYDAQNVILRYHPDIHVDEIWIDHYHGGTVRAEAVHPFKMAALVVAKQYIGPMGGVPVTATSPVVPQQRPTSDRSSSTPG